MIDNDATPPPASSVTNKREAQMKKLKDANTKYKDLLKMAKGRIQAQEEELEGLKAALKEAEQKAPAVVQNDDGESEFYSHKYDVPQSNASMDQGIITVTKVCQRIMSEQDDENDRMAMSISNDSEQEINRANTIWALIEYEHNLADTTEALIAPTKRFQRWRSFRTENDLADHIRRNTGEPIHLPPYSLSPVQSERIEDEARQAVAHVTEEFRRFRVRSEVARKQSNATVRALQSNNVQSAQKHIEGEDIASELEQARSDHENLRVLKIEFAEQEAQWKEAYDALLNENNALKSSGSEALLAAQWRRRYESCLEEKEKALSVLEMERQKSGRFAHERRKDDSGKYESKYKDLKESFRIYRKKAKEIFEAQQKGEVAILEMGDTSSEEAKISYLRNLMVNYLSSDPAVREHMEGAIGTVLKFSTDDCSRISDQKKMHQAASSWFS